MTRTVPSPPPSAGGLEEMLDSHDLITVVQAAPSVRVTISEAFGLPPGAVSTGQLVTALKAVGFDYVFDTNVRIILAASVADLALPFRRHLLTVFTFGFSSLQQT